MADKTEAQKDIEKYEGEIAEINKQITALDDRKTQLLRVGFRIEGILAYLRNKQAPDAAPDAAGGAEQPAAEAKA